MARGTTLIKLLDMLRAEIKVSLNPAHNQQVRDEHVNALQQAQNEVWEDFDWPTLRIERQQALFAGQRLYSPPADIGIDRIEKVEVRWGGSWMELPEGIGAQEYSLWDSALDERSWPIARWRIYEGEQIEVWPIPADAGTASDLEGYLRVTGIKKLGRLVDDSDTADLDDRLIVLRASLRYFKPEDRKLTLDAYNKRFMTLRGNYAPRKSFQLFGSSPRNERPLRGPARVHYRDRQV